VKASSSREIFLRVLRRAMLANTLGSRSPATSAAGMSRPDIEKMSEATTEGLIWASETIRPNPIKLADILPLVPDG
jgi:hypothetical protein